jgi:hypothetical protein
MNPIENDFQEPGGSSLLNNMGGPISRVRTEKINSSLFDHPGMDGSREIHFLDVPEWEEDLEEWYLSIARKLHWNKWEEALPSLKLPAGRWLILPARELLKPTRVLLTGKLRSAVILSKCNKSHYSPDSPMIFTRSRLERKIEMIRINLNSYYEMD